MEASGFPSCKDCKKASGPDCFIVQVTRRTIDSLNKAGAGIYYPPVPHTSDYPEGSVCSFHSKYEEMAKWGEGVVETFKTSSPILGTMVSSLDESDFSKLFQIIKVEDGKSDNLSK